MIKQLMAEYREYVAFMEAHDAVPMPLDEWYERDYTEDEPEVEAEALVYAGHDYGYVRPCDFPKSRGPLLARIGFVPGSR